MRLPTAPGCVPMLLIAFVAGCGSPQPTLHGSVTIDGQSAPAGISLEFVPTGPGTSCYATTDESGRYEAMLTFRNKGIGLGEHRVRLMPGSGVSSEPASRLKKQPQPERPKTTFPEQVYRAIETIDVKPGRNRHDIALTTAK